MTNMNKVENVVLYLYVQSNMETAVVIYTWLKAINNKFMTL